MIIRIFFSFKGEGSNKTKILKKIEDELFKKDQAKLRSKRIYDYYLYLDRDDHKDKTLIQDRRYPEYITASRRSNLIIVIPDPIYCDSPYCTTELKEFGDFFIHPSYMQSVFIDDNDKSDFENFIKHVLPIPDEITKDNGHIMYPDGITPEYDPDPKCEEFTKLISYIYQNIDTMKDNVLSNKTAILGTLNFNQYEDESGIRLIGRLEAEIHSSFSNIRLSPNLIKAPKLKYRDRSAEYPEDELRRHSENFLFNKCKRFIYLYDNRNVLNTKVLNQLQKSLYRYGYDHLILIVYDFKGFMKVGSVLLEESEVDIYELRFKPNNEITKLLDDEIELLEDVTKKWHDKFQASKNSCKVREFLYQSSYKSVISELQRLKSDEPWSCVDIRFLKRLVLEDSMFNSHYEKEQEVSELRNKIKYGLEYFHISPVKVKKSKDKVHLTTEEVKAVENLIIFSLNLPSDENE